MVSSGSRLAVLSLMLVLFLDGLGQGIVFPIYSKVLFDPHAALLAATTTSATRNLWYGVLIGVFFLCWFLGAAVLSDLSDKSGRKKALLICLGGSALGNLLSALAFSVNNIWILLLGRILVGLTNGSQPIAQASIVDTTPKEKLSHTLGLIVMAVCVGLILGPLVGGFLSDPTYISWLTDSTPLYLAAILAVGNIFLLLFFYQETALEHARVKVNLARAIQIFISAFRQRSVRFLSICYFFLQLGWNLYYVYISAYMVEKYALSKTAVTLFFTLAGIGLVVGLAGLSRYFGERKVAPKRVTALGYGGVLIGLFITTLPNEQIWPWLVTFLIGASVGVGYAFILTLFSGQVSASQQGWVMGITSSLMAFGAGIASLGEGILSSIDLKLPLYICIGCSLFGLVLFFWFKPTEPS